MNIGALNFIKTYRLIFLSLLFFTHHSFSQSISQLATNILLKDSAISKGNIGISIYEPATNRYWFNYNGTKYFIPASNTKLFSLYAGMKYLGDSLAGLRYEVNSEGDYTLYPCGDPSFLHTDFDNQPVLSFLKNINSDAKVNVASSAWKTTPWGKGWAWDDYSDDYMAERSLLPMYGNVIHFFYQQDSLIEFPDARFPIHYSTDFQFEQAPDFLFAPTAKNKNFSLRRNKDKNSYEFIKSTKNFEPIAIPFITTPDIILKMLKDTLQNLKHVDFTLQQELPSYKNLKTLYTQSVDSLFKPMMYRSDNFFAEQTLLMASNEYLGYMNEKTMIDTLLKSDLKDIPQKPQWVDGSGLSRYNLFTPQSFIYILAKLKKEFGFDRLKKILPTGGLGTLKNYYNEIAGYIFAKTGTLSNHVALSGYLITKKRKLLIFSILAGNYPSGATPIRTAVEKFIVKLRENY